MIQMQRFKAESEAAAAERQQRQLEEMLLWQARQNQAPKVLELDVRQSSGALPSIEMILSQEASQPQQQMLEPGGQRPPGTLPTINQL